MAVNFDEPLQEFFDRFELPIRSVEFMCINMGGQILSNVRFYIIPCDSVVELEKQRGILLDKCSLFSRFVFPWNKEGYKDFPDYETIHRSIPELRKDSIKTVKVISDSGRFRAVLQGAARFCNSGNNAYLVEESNLWSYETEHYIFVGGIGVHDGHCTQARLCGLQAAVGLWWRYGRLFGLQLGDSSYGNK